MYVSREKLLAALPPYRDEWVTVKKKQDVNDIISDMLDCHQEFAGYYDTIAPYFDCGNLRDTCELLYSFCINNIQYVEESEDLQTTALPAGILTRGYGDCKHYASFIGGVLGALCREGQPIKWHYCFASYDLLQPDPYHVFIVVDNVNGKPLYIDPTPGANNKTPLWVKTAYTTDLTKEKKITGFSSWAVDKNGLTMGATAAASYGTLYPVPSWYPAYLPKFYNSGNAVILRPLNAVPNYTQNDVLDIAIYLQTIIGYNRTDFQNARSAAWQYADKSGGAKIWIKSALQKDGNGDGGGNFANISSNNQSVDGAFYSAIQTRYIFNEQKTMPWLINMQGVGGGIDLMTLPSPADTPIARPSFYANYLPSLYVTAGGVPGQYPAGHLDTKPKIRTGKSSGFKNYVISPNDVANLMVYAQPVINAGPSPYPTNWYINDFVNGAMAFKYKISLQFSDEFTNSQEQSYGIAGNMYVAPVLDANPFASKFSETMESIISAAISYFSSKVPGGTALIKAGQYAATLSGGQVVTGGPVPPGVFSAEVFNAADALQTQVTAQQTTKTYLMLAAFAAAILGWYYWPEIKKQL